MADKKGTPEKSSRIIYVCVARKDVILADYAIKEFPADFHKVVKRILEQIPQTDGKLSYSFESHYFHYDVSDGIVFLCMAPESFGRRLPFAFLEDIKGRFKSTYGAKSNVAVAYAYQADFSRILQKQMDYFSTDSNADRITQLRAGLAEVHDVMVDSIEKVLERGESIEHLLGRTENLQATSVNFKRKSEDLKNAMWWRNIKIYGAIFFVVVVIILIIVAVACGGVSWPNCIKRSGPTVAPTTTVPTTSPTASPTPPSAPSV
jgi:vesicle-associated membrane protein 7